MTPPFIKRYWIALDRHKWVGIAGFLLVAGLSGVAAVLQPPPSETYISEGILTYGAPPDTFSATGSALQQQGQSVTKEMLLSEQVINAAIQQLEAEKIRLSSQSLLRRTKVTVTGNEAAAGSEGKSAAQGLRIKVIYQDGSEERSQTVMTALLQAMIDQSRQFNTQQLRRVIDNLNQLLPKVTGELRSAERRLEDYVQREGTALDAAKSGSLLTAITGSQQQQRQIRLALTGINAQLQSLQTRLGMTPEEAYLASALSADPIVADLRARLYQVESQQQIFAKTLRPDHPIMLELRDQLDVFEQQLQMRVGEVLGGNFRANPLDSNSDSASDRPSIALQQIRQASSLDPARQALADTLVALATQQQTLQQQLTDLARSEQELRQEYARIPNRQLEQQRLQQQVALKQAFYDQVQTRLADAKLAQEETVGSLVVAEPPETEAIQAARLSGGVIVLLGGVLGVLVGGGLVMLLGMIDPTFYTPEDIQAALRQQEVPVLGILPLLPQESEEADALPGAIPLVAADSPYLDRYERLRTALKRMGSETETKVILITSTVSGEGKTVTAYNLAIAGARAGKRTLLIEADLRSPSQSSCLNLSEAEPTAPSAAYCQSTYQSIYQSTYQSIYQSAAQSAAQSIYQPAAQSAAQPTYYQPDRCIRSVPAIDRLFVVPSPAPQRYAAALLESPEMRQLLEAAREQFDWVVLDTPALSRSSDALLLEPLTDGILLVARPGLTEEGILTETTQQFLEAEDIQFFGVLINGADLALAEDDFTAEPAAESIDSLYAEMAQSEAAG